MAVATLIGSEPHGWHRTFTHSVFTILGIWILFYTLSKIRKEPYWQNLGLGLSIGVGMHMLLDLVGWFNGVALTWPLQIGTVNFWASAKPPDWFSTLMGPAEFLMFALYLMWLGKTAQKQNSDPAQHKGLRNWIIGMWAGFIILTPLAYVMTTGYLTLMGTAYLIALTAAFVITIKMRKTIADFSAG